MRDPFEVPSERETVFTPSAYPTESTQIKAGSYAALRTALMFIKTKKSKLFPVASDTAGVGCSFN